MIEHTVNFKGGRRTHTRRVSLHGDTGLHESYITLCGINLRLHEWEFTTYYTPTCSKCLALFNKKVKT